MKVEDLHLGPLSTRRQHRQTPRSNHPEDPRKRSLQNQAAPIGVSTDKYWQARRTRYQKCNRSTQDTELWVQKRKDDVCCEESGSGLQ